MKKLFTLITGLAVGASAMAQTYLPMKDFQDQSITSGGWTSFVVHDPVGTHDWVTQDLGSAGDFYAIATGWNGASADTTVMWLISPSFDLTSATMPELHFENAQNFGGYDLELVISTDYDGSSDPTAQGTWDTITTSATWSTGGFAWTTSAVDLSAYNGNNSVYVGFAYASGPVAGAKSWEVDSVDVTEFAAPTFTSLYDIQYSTTSPFDSPYNGQTVTTHGIVTAVDTGQLGFWVQDTMGAAWNGLYIYNPGGNEPAIGDSLQITGNIIEFNGLTEMNQVSNITVVNSGNAVSPAVITTLNGNEEMYESCFIRVEAATCTNPVAGFGQFEVNDGSGALLVDDRMYDHFANQNDVYNVQGVSFYAFSEWKMLPRMMSDVEDITSVEDMTSAVSAIYPNPVQDVLIVELSDASTDMNLRVIDAMGRVVVEMGLNGSRTEVDFSNLASGVYQVTLTSENGIESFSVVK